MPVTQLLKVSITVEHLSATAAMFYASRLGLTAEPQTPVYGQAFRSLLDLDESVSIQALSIRVGKQEIELLRFTPEGAPYPSERASNDQWFQHVALVCGDISAVWQRLKATPSEAITEGAPVLLPPNTGSVTAFKFRDPEGHPLELISFPQGVGAPVWQQSSGSGILGYDHTAISVMDLDRSIAFYQGLLGLTIAGRSLNTGPEQGRLDGLEGCEVDVVALAPASVTTPHVELLHYRTPRGRSLSTPVRANDVASARQVHKVDDLEALVRRLVAAGVEFVSPGVVTLRDGARAAAVRDPDGHMIVFMG
jgi:catechol 2,3-dioxygenase-like lactoylglutathione lyase family enzyme